MTFFDEIFRNDSYYSSGARDVITEGGVRGVIGAREPWYENRARIWLMMRSEAIAN